jgi:hypothetical protein
MSPPSHHTTFGPRNERSNPTHFWCWIWTIERYKLAMVTTTSYKVRSGRSSTLQKAYEVYFQIDMAWCHIVFELASIINLRQGHVLSMMMHYPMLTRWTMYLVGSINNVSWGWSTCLTPLWLSSYLLKGFRAAKNISRFVRLEFSYCYFLLKSHVSSRHLCYLFSRTPTILYFHIKTFILIYNNSTIVLFVLAGSTTTCKTSALMVGMIMPHKIVSNH